MPKLRAMFAALVLAAPAAFAAPKVPALRLYVFDCGAIDVADVSMFSPGVDQGKSKHLTDSCYLVAHPKGTLIWDTGFSDDLAKQKDGAKIGEAFHIYLKQPLAGQLKKIGYRPSDITYLGLSHMHFDHTGNVNLFPHAHLLMQKEEYAAALGPDAAKLNYDPATYPNLAKNPVTQLEGDHDVFGDGSVIIKRAVGHTPGHQMLLVKLPKTGAVLLSGDVAHFTENWEQRRVPSFNVDKAASVKAMEDTAAWIKANKAQFWIQHDAEQNAKIKHAPAFYE